MDGQISIGAALSIATTIVGSMALAVAALWRTSLKQAEALLKEKDVQIAREKELNKDLAPGLKDVSVAVRDMLSEYRREYRDRERR